MTKITAYIADDGKEFEYEDECRRYELECKMKVTHGLKLWRTTPTGYERVNCDGDGLKFTELCIIENDTALELIKDAGYEYGYEVPTELGMWYWDGSEWLNWEFYEEAFNAFQFMKQQSNIVQF